MDLLAGRQRPRERAISAHGQERLTTSEETDMAHLIGMAVPGEHIFPRRGVPKADCVPGSDSQCLAIRGKREARQPIAEWRRLVEFPASGDVPDMQAIRHVSNGEYFSICRKRRAPSRVGVLNMFFSGQAEPADLPPQHRLPEVYTHIV